MSGRESGTAGAQEGKPQLCVIAHAALAAAPPHGLAVSLLSPASLLMTFRVAGVFAVLFAETGLLIGFFRPGDTMLFTAGLLSATSGGSALHLPLGWLLAAAAAGALCGAQACYLLGGRGGRAPPAPPPSPPPPAGSAHPPLLPAPPPGGTALVLAP